MDTAITWFRGEGKGMVVRWSWFGSFPNEASGGNANGIEDASGAVSSICCLMCQADGG
jgi:hypothetical protein